jgi:putative membrane protein
VAGGPALPPFAWTWGSLHPEVVLAAGLAATAWAWAWHRRGTRPPPWQAARFVGALLALLLALNGPLHDLSDWYLFSAHMVQHLVLTLVVPPLLLTGMPAWMLDALLQPLLAWPAGRALLRLGTRPLPAFALYAAALVAWHLPGPYNAALEVHGWHVVEHAVLLAAAVAGWWPIVSPSRLAPALPYAAQLLYLFVFGMPMTVVAAMITAAEHVLYPFYAAAPRVFDLTPLADQRLGGVIMWVPSGLIPLTAFTIVFFRWAAAEADETA